MEEPGRLQSMGCKESDMIERLHFHFQVYSYVLGSRVIDHLVKDVAIKFAWNELLVSHIFRREKKTFS